MKRLLVASFACVLLAACSAVAADPPGPGKNFDCSKGGTTSCASDDTGCVPGSKDNPGAANVAATLKCADAIAKAFAKAIGSVIKCHKKQADQAFKNAPMDDESCETGPAGGKSAKEKLDAAIAKVASLCTATELASAGAEETTLFAGQSNPLSLDAQNGNVYCDSTSGVLIDQSGDDAGFVPADGNQLKCADAVGKELGKLAAAAIKCHVKMADAFFNGKDFDENICEENDPAKHKSALEKYNAAMTKLTAKNICTQPCLSAGNRTTLGANILAQVEAANVVIYPCPTTTSTTTTTSTSTTTSTCPTPVNACTCTGGTPLQYKFTTSIGVGNCGHLDADGNPNFFPLQCGGLYFGGGSVSVPQPAAVPDNFSSIIHACCDGSTLTLSGTASAEVPSSDICSGGSRHHMSYVSNFDCPTACIGGPNDGDFCEVAQCIASTCSGGTCAGGVNVGKACCGAPGNCNFGSCKFQTCTTTGCLFGPPLPIPNGAHGNAAASTCGILTITANATGTADCSTGEAHTVNLPLNDLLFLDGDMLSMRCSGGTTPGAPCAGGGGCGTTAAGSCPGGTCVNDTGRCSDTGAICCGDPDCPTGSCETGACVGGANAGKGCITDGDCPGSTCKTFIQVCPVCDTATNTCDGGPNTGLACTPQSLNPNGDYPTSHECPPPSANAIGSLAVGFVLDTGTLTRTATNLLSQVNVFCGYCKNSTTNQFARRCNGSPSGASCICAPGGPCGSCGGAPCLPVQCNVDADCGTVTGFASCGQHTSGAFTNTAVARTIVETGNPAVGVTVGGAPVASTLVSIFCIPPSYNLLVDSAGDLPGPGAVSLYGTAQLLP